MKGVTILIIAVLALNACAVFAQTGKPVVIPTDSTTQRKNPAFTKDTGIVIKNNDTIKTVSKHNPRTATLRSLILPGWGQAYNREYWKIPIVYGALAIPVSLYIYNNNYYQMTKFAYNAVYSATLETPIDNSQLLK